MTAVVPFGRRHGRAVFYADRRLMSGQGWKRARWVVICEYNGVLAAWWSGMADKKTAHWLAGIQLARFRKGRALMSRCGPGFVITIEDDTRARVFWAGDDYDAAGAVFDQLDGGGIFAIDLTEADYCDGVAVPASMNEAST